MKICKSCNEKKPESEFYQNKKKNGNPTRSECKKCSLKKKRLREQKHNQEYDKWFKTIPKECEKCGETRSYMIDFHHVDPLLKECEIAEIRSRSWTAKRKIQMAKLEMEKCIQLCSNCHREFHYLEKNFDFTIDEYI